MAQEKSGRLKELLSKIASQESDIDTAGAELDREFGRDCTVMISDFSSFLGLAMEKGIVSALSMVEKAHEIAEPILGTLGGEVLQAEPDRLVVIFSKPLDAVMAARAVGRAFEEHNTEKVGDANLALCLGIGHGRMLVTENQVYGDQAIIAGRLGKAIEGKFEARLTPEAYEGVKQLESLTFSPAEPIMIGGVSITPYHLVYA